MGMDVDYIFGNDAISELEEMFCDTEHDNREEFCDDIVEFVEKMKKKYGQV